MSIEDEINRMERRIEKFRELLEFIDALEAIETNLQPDSLAGNWAVTFQPENVDEPDLRLNLPGGIFGQLVGAGLRVLLPKMREARDQFRLNE